MSAMTLKGCRPWPAGVRACATVAAVFILAAGGAGFSRSWNRRASERAFEEAGRLRSVIEEKSSASREQYLQCIHAYQQVYFQDPHYRASGTSAFEAGQLYQEMGEKFGDLKYYKLAARQYRFVAKEYPHSPKCPDALLKAAELFAGPLGDESTAREAYDQLERRYKSSAAAKVARQRGLSQEVRPQGDERPVRASRSSGAPSLIYAVRHWSMVDSTRVSIDLDKEARYPKTRLAHPDRIYLDIQPSKLASDLVNKTIVVGDEFLKRVRVGQNQLDVVRIVLDFAGSGDYSIFELYDPFRIIIEIHGNRGAPSSQKLEPRAVPANKIETAEAESATPPPSDSARALLATTAQQVVENEIRYSRSRADQPPPETSKFKAAQPSAEGRESLGQSRSQTKTPGVARVAETKLAEDLPPLPPPSDPPTLPRAATPTSRGDRTLTRILGLKIGRIVLDPGHGGHDTGTIGPGGTKEKELVLQVAHQLKKLLEDRLGAEVVLTRRDDTFIPLEERTAIANEHQADLFVSIHANSSRTRSASGVETYYLNFARSSEAREVAARENATTVRNIRDLEDFVRRITRADKSVESRELASLLQKRLYRGARKVYPDAQDRGVRTAPFVVLVGANMPSVLAEVGFISNPRDERLLRKEANRTRLAEALFAGIVGYMKTLGSNVALNRAN